MKSELSIAVVQTDAGPDPAENLQRLESLLHPIGAADLIALPEVFAARGSDDDLRRAAQPMNGPIVSWLRGLAQSQNAWVLGGSVMEQVDDRIYNTSVLIDRQGAIAATYRKIHLFEVHMEDGKTIREADIYSGGDTPVPADVEGWKCGLSICYDVRFPELYRHYSDENCDLCFIPSNFTQRTGKDHWHVLLRARAIENQCYIVAPAQCGMMPGHDIETHGHSMIVGPWGEVLCEAGREETVLPVVLDKETLWATRARVPALEHRRL